MSNLFHWSPSVFYDRSRSLTAEAGDGQVYCQAVVQVLIGDAHKGWHSSMIGELVLYSYNAKSENERNDLFLSFFASERFSFIIKMSDGARFWRTKANFLVIEHGQLIGFNFCVEHLHKVNQLVKHMHGSVPLVLSSRFLRVIQKAMHHLHVRPNKDRDELVKKEEGVKGLDPVREPRAFLHRVTLADSDDI
ncbi:unnamed protein product [Bursaphelenchus okinawaensis]|uniref:Uncharacterized protein n=1 Tax=Bursaphelenchus okinawaensis TaxID=465554 RepID=A0A811KUG1_9BILA|nr:unnamed protein product [Bursaphelenchus okinawaensis]CAG9112325.1 unnamed protein product [Bursaphelenchus okinawaensis]